MTNIPTFDPNLMKELCANVGALHLFPEVMNMITIPGQSRETHDLRADKMFIKYKTNFEIDSH